MKSKVDYVKNVDLTSLPIRIVNTPRPRYRFGQVMGVVIPGIIAFTLLYLTYKPVYGYPVLALAVWSLLFGEFQVRVLAPKAKITYTIDTAGVRCERPHSAGPDASWLEPMSHYAGIERSLDHRAKGVARPRPSYILELKHKSDQRRSVLLYMGVLDTFIDKLHEEAARTLGVAKL